MRKLPLIVVLALAFFVPSSGVSAVNSNDGETIEYLIEVEGTQGNISRSANGDTIEVVGHGTFSLEDDDEITGRGTWVHRSAAGAVLARGTWRAKELFSYETYGPQAVVDGIVLPPGSEGGYALIGIRMRVNGGGPAFNAVLAIDCLLGNQIQDGATHEGITLDPTNGPGKRRNFENQVHGLTLFIRHGENDD